MAHEAVTTQGQLTPRIEDAWYVLCQSDALRQRPVKHVLMGKPVVLFRNAEGVVGCLEDRCPHRGVPLSAGRVIDGRLQCSYHGWEFDCTGACTRVPALVGAPGSAARSVPSHPVVEQQGFVWVYGTPGPMPDSRPFRFRYLDDPRYLVVKYEVRAPAGVHAVAENALDVPHTAFLHAGLFRNDERRNRIRCVVKRWADRVECQYIGEPRPPGLVGRLLAPSGGIVTHFDRFYLPSVVEVEYSLGEENHIVVNGACTPVTDTETRLFSVTAVRSRLPGWLIRPFVQPVALRIFDQDRRILSLQTQAMETFGDAAYASTDVDLLGPHILKLMHRAARGHVGEGGEPWTTEVEMDV